ncbi:MAG TPA: BON domain-containing protein [Gammaproteobacteria bacterium]|nr:BON domain-containing protein [Gammaproteobacteria bacterium]
MKSLNFVKTLVLGALILCCGVSFAAQTEVPAVVADSVITTKIKSSYAHEKLFGTKDISMMGVTVTTKDGIVHLAGTVDNQLQADNAVKLAKEVDGVKSVDSTLVVRPATN